MADPVVLIISAAGDWSAEAVAAALEVHYVRVVTVDTGDFPLRMRLAAQLGDSWSGALSTAAGTVELSRISAVYYRRPNDFDLPAGLSGPERRFAAAQARTGLGGVLASLPVRWINHPAAIADCEYKPRQLAVAAECGLTVPATLITNDPGVVTDFAATYGDLVVKPLSDPLVYEAGDTSIVYTRRVTVEDLKSLSTVDTTAHLFQEWVPPTPCAARVTVVGETIFPVAIYPESEQAREDWRADYASLRYAQIDLPGPVTDGLMQFMRRFDLLYGAVDFIVRDDEFVFLECNAAGQFGWLAEECQLPIAETIACELIGE